MNTIIITENDIKDFEDYRGDHYFENFIFKDFKIVFKRTDFKIIYKIHIDGKINHVEFRVIKDGWYKDCEFTFEDGEDNISFIEKPKGDFVNAALENSDENMDTEKEITDYFLTEALFLSYMKQYIMNKSYERKVIMKESKNVPGTERGVGNTRKSSKTSSNKPVTQFLLNDIIEYTSCCDSKQRGYHCECWGVRGHFRRYKTGKVVWIDSYEKGKCRNAGKTVSNKTYKL